MILYLLAKLGVGQGREVSLLGFPNFTQREFIRWMQVGTAQIDVFATLNGLQECVEGFKDPAVRFLAMDTDFKVFQAALRSLAKEDGVEGLIDYEKDKLFSENVASLKVFYETREKHWKAIKMFELMRLPKNNVSSISVRQASDWLLRQSEGLTSLKLRMSEVRS